jgi:hypothetical protein
MRFAIPAQFPFIRNPPMQIQGLPQSFHFFAMFEWIKRRSSSAA